MGAVGKGRFNAFLPSLVRCCDHVAAGRAAAPLKFHLEFMESGLDFIPVRL
jgi:hypothetical protein